MPVKSARGGYVYLLMVGTNRTDFNLLFPNTADEKKQIAAGEIMHLPRGGWNLGAFGPAGTDHFVAIVSNLPRRFDKAGLKLGELFGEFQPAAVEKAARVAPATAPAFAGSVVCAAAAAAPDCSESYSIPQFSSAEVAAKP